MSKYKHLFATESIDTTEADSLHNNGDETIEVDETEISPIDTDYVIKEATNEFNDLEEINEVIRSDYEAGVPVTESAVIMLGASLKRIEEKFGIKADRKPKFAKENFTKTPNQNKKFHLLALEASESVVLKGRRAIRKLKATKRK